MFMKKRVLPEVDEVKLPHIFGMRPGKYILILLVLAVLLVLFLLGFLPGIVKGGRYVHFESDYSSVGIVVDGRYLGSSEGSRLFIPSGRHKVDYIKSGEIVLSDEIRMDHPIFLTLLFKRTATITADIPADENIYRNALEMTLEELPLYSGLFEYSSAYNYRPLFSLLARDAAAANVKDVSNDLLLQALFISSEEMYRDYLESVEIYRNAGIKYESEALGRVDAALEKLVAANGDFRTYSAALPSFSPARTDDGFAYPETTFTLGSDTIESWEGLSIYPVDVTVGKFTLSQKLVSEYDWALFIEANPYWAKDNIDAIVKDGMADEYYLAGVFPSVNVHTDKPVRNISYYAAMAYAEWISSRTGKNYRLPTEAELELAMDLTGEAPATSLRYSDYSDGPLSLLGGLWEMTSTSYLPLARISGNYDLSETEIGDMVVKGGSHVAPSSPAYEVGVLDRKDCSEYLGLRLAIGK